MQSRWLIRFFLLLSVNFLDKIIEFRDEIFCYISYRFIQILHMTSIEEDAEV